MKQLFLLSLLLFGMTAFAQDSFVTEADLEGILESHLEPDGPGMVLYVVDFGEAYAAAYGSANMDDGTPVTTTDYFRIGSMTKPMVATTLLALVEDGQLDLDDPLADYVPDEIVSNIANADQATLRQALQMTSGITDYLNTDEFFDAVEDDPNIWWTAESTLTYAYGLPADFALGESYEYSNSNYNLAQIVIETVTGQSLAEAMAEWVFEPAEMDECYLETEDTRSQNIVRGYRIGDSGYEDVTDINDGLGMGDGGVVCTAESLALFLPALINEEIIGAEMLEEMLDGIDDGSGGAYGLGIGIDESDGLTFLGHAGATNGFEGVMTYIVEEEVVIIVLSNQVENEAVEVVSDDAIALVFGEL
jgi:D-alanyl-D-alanine carboxypeptidase